MKKSERLLNLVLLLKTGSSYTPRDFANKFDVSVRTVYRDISDLSRHVPVYYDNGYRLLVNRNPVINPFTNGELKEIRRIIETVTDENRENLNPMLSSALKRIDELLVNAGAYQPR
ncbi:MAG: HTH domain-containing protein [bacterium]|nr:HTH domain-containing protein [bacterium]